MYLKIPLLVLSFIFVHSIFGQRQGEIWHFSDSVVISLASGDPVLLDESSMFSFEGCVSYCDENGDLLFYSNGGGRPPASLQDGGTIWNRNHEVMYDMMGSEGGGFSAQQSSLVVPRPGAPDQYYLFTMEENEFDLGGSIPGQPEGRGLSYFMIDMNLNGGLGEVIGGGDTRLYTPVFESLTGTVHQNGEDYWIVCVERQEESNINRFVVHEVNENGVFGPQFWDIPFGQSLGGQIKMSPDGRWLFSNSHLYGFDKSTGEISNPFPDPLIEAASAASFTNDSRFIYLIGNSNPNQFSVFRYALTPDFTEEVLADLLPFSPPSTGMQLAPNGDIYYTEFTSAPFLSRIRCPSSPEPVVESQLLALNNDNILITLPNFTDHLFFSQASADTTIIEEVEIFICEGLDTTLLSPVIGETYNWSTGDTSIAITVDMAGVYDVIVTDPCGNFSQAIFQVELADEGCEEEECEYNIPNVFTPNGDGENDRFGIFSNCTSEEYDAYQLEIYSRWGQLVFSSSSPDQAWDGFYQGEPSPSDVYIYQLRFQFVDNEPVVEKGQLSLLR